MTKAPPSPPPRGPLPQAELQTQVAAFQWATPEEQTHQARILGHINAGGPLFLRSRMEGHLTGSAFVLDAKSEKLLLIFHRKLGRWLQPGGHGDPEETNPAEVAMREAEEETGISGLKFHPAIRQPFDLDVHTIPASKKEGAHEHLDIRYALIAPPNARLRLAEEEVAGARWASLQEATQVKDESVARAARKLAKLLAGPTTNATVRPPSGS